MNNETVVAKTEKGHREISTRQNQLGFAHRAALIQSDGKKTAQQDYSRIPGASLATIEELHRDGYLEFTAGGALTPMGNPPASPLPPAISIGDISATQFDLLASQRRAVRALSDLLGPGGDTLAITIERTASREEFGVATLKSADVIGKIAGSDKAKLFLRKVAG